jgi:antitoxin component YwqK of YwqJK toxin-antitoxin module
MDLQNIFDIYPEIRRITESQHFIDSWKAYNIHIVEKHIDVYIPRRAIIEVDRLGHRHGTTRIQDYDGVLWSTAEYVNNLKQGTEMRYTGTIRTETYWHLGLKQGLGKCYTLDGILYKTFMYVNNKQNGLEISYNINNVTHSWVEHVDGVRHGKHIEWYPNGGRKCEKTWYHNMSHGIQKCWNEDGTLVCNN